MVTRLADPYPQRGKRGPAGDPRAPAYHDRLPGDQPESRLSLGGKPRQPVPAERGLHGPGDG